jgi:hypothetical protein
MPTGVDAPILDVCLTAAVEQWHALVRIGE